MKPNFFKKKDDPKSDLFSLIENGSADDFENLFEEIGENCFGFVNENGETLLISACKKGKFEIAQILLINSRLMPNPNENSISSNKKSYITHKDKENKSALFYAYENALFEIIPYIILCYDLHEIDKETLTEDADLYKNLEAYIQNEKLNVTQAAKHDRFEEVIIKGIKRLNPNSEDITTEMREDAITRMYKSLRDSTSIFLDTYGGSITPDITTLPTTSLLSPFQSSKSGETTNISGQAENKVESEAPKTSPQVGYFSTQEEAPNAQESQEQKIELEAPRTSPQIGYFSSLISCLCRPFQKNNSRVVVGGNGRE